MRLALKQQEAAESLGMGLDLFRRLVDRGIMPRPIDLDGNKRWRVRDLEAALDRLAANSNDDPIMKAAKGAMQ